MSGKTALILLHGSGGDGLEVRSFLECVTLKDFGHNTFVDVAEAIGMDVITPTSDIRRYTAMNYERLHIWFDRTAKFFTKDGLDDVEDLDGIELSLQKIFKIIEEIEPKYDHIFLGGHSMGGVLVLHTLRKNFPSKVRGIFSISSCLLNMSEVFVGPGLGNASKLPLMMMHGKVDDMVPCDWGSKTASALLIMGVDVQFRSYDNVYHGLEEEELCDIMHWMRDILHNYNSTHSSNIPIEKLKISNEEEEEESNPKAGKNTLEDIIQSVDMLVKGHSSSSSGPTDCVPYTLEYGSKPTEVTIRFAVPLEYIGVMASRPVLACGSTFEIIPDPPHGVKTFAISSDPNRTATEIGRRLFLRATSGSATLNPCAMS